MAEQMFAKHQHQQQAQRYEAVVSRMLAALPEGQVSEVVSKASRRHLDTGSDLLADLEFYFAQALAATQGAKHG